MNKIKPLMVISLLTFNLYAYNNKCFENNKKDLKYAQELKKEVPLLFNVLNDLKKIAAKKGRKIVLNKNNIQSLSDSKIWGYLLYFYSTNKNKYYKALKLINFNKSNWCNNKENIKTISKLIKANSN